MDENGIDLLVWYDPAENKTTVRVVDVFAGVQAIETFVGDLVPLSAMYSRANAEIKKPRERG